MSGNTWEQDCGRGRWNEVFWVFERQVLVFPLLVVFLACASFLFGGRCAAWQWWTAMGMVVGVPFLKRGEWRAALGAAGLFAGVLLAVKCLLPPVLWDNVALCEDMQVYHLPQIQLLIEGWNPVEDPLAEGICAKLGLDLWGMAPLHVAFLPKTMAVFAAVAYKFVGDPTSLTIPGLAFLWLGVALQVLRQFRALTRWVILAALIWILPKVDWRMYVDESIAFASCGLLFAMADDLKQRRVSWLRLGVWTIWVVTIKLNGVLTAAVFWGMYAGVSLWRERHRKMLLSQFAIWGAVVGMVSAVVVWHPYGTSWQRFGHPLYPFATVDENTHPVQDLTWDFRVGNDDYHQMGRVGLWVYEYVSPGLAKAFYKWKLESQDFKPERFLMGTRYWIDPIERVALWLIFVFLFFHPCLRFLGVGGLLLTFLSPKELIGYLRYFPWLNALGCLAIAFAMEIVSESLPVKWRKILGRTVLIVICLAGISWLWQHSRDVPFKSTEMTLARPRIRTRFFVDYRDYNRGVEPKDFTPRYDFLTCMENQCRILAREMNWNEIEILPALGWQAPWDRREFGDWPMWKWSERTFFVPEAEKDKHRLGELGVPWHVSNVWDGADDGQVGEAWLMTPWTLYYVPYDEKAGHIMEYWRGGERREGEGRLAHVARRGATVAKTWGVTYPKEAWKWLRGRGGTAMLPQIGREMNKGDCIDVAKYGQLLHASKENAGELLMDPM